MTPAPHPVPHPTPHTSPRFLKHWLLLALALLILGGNIAYEQYHARQRIADEARQRLQNYSLVLSEELERRLTSMNGVLEHIRDTIPAQLPQKNAAGSAATTRVAKELTTLTKALEGIRTLAVFDAQGTMVASNRSELVGQNFAQRAYFQTIKNAPNRDTLYLSEPFITSLGTYTIIVARMVPDAQGAFAGMASATLDSESIAALLHSMHGGEETTLAVVHGNGKILQLVPKLTNAPPGFPVTTAGSFFRQHVQSGREASLMTGISAVTGTRRVMSMRTLKPAKLHIDTPLLISASRDHAAVLADWRLQARNGALWFLFVSLCSVLGMLFYQRRQRRFDRQLAQKETARQRSVQVLQHFIDHLPGTAYVKDADSRTLMANRGFQTLLGTDPASMIGKTSLELFPGEFGEKIIADDRRVFDSGQTTHIEESFNGRDYESIKFVIDNGDGRHLLGGVTMDISARKEAERKLVEQMAHLAELNHKLEDAQIQLLQSEKMASIGQLAAGVAHELNNPIGFVHSNLGTLDTYLKSIFEIAKVCETAALSAANPDDFAHIEAIKIEKDFDYIKTDIVSLMAESKDGLARVKKIIQDLRDFSRVGETEWQIADIHAGIDSTLNIVWNELKYKCTVTKHYDNTLPPIHCLASQLNQVFMNLLMNAAQAIETTGEIIITTRRVDEASIQIEFTDNGSGIASEHLKRVFEPFFTTKPVGKGTGLGLSIAYGIIGRHHGSISVSSTPGVGTTFVITLPINLPEPEPPPPPSPQ